MPKRTTNLVIISGPSGAGEDSVIEGLRERNIPIKRVITTVTRNMRPKEKQGKPYYFVSMKKFENMIQNNELAEWAQVYDSKRGATKKELERIQTQKDKIGLWKIDWHGVKTAKELFPDILAIMISVPDIDELVERLEDRGDPKQNIQSRIDFTKEWLEHKNIYDYEVINKENKLNQTIDKVIEILKKEGFIDKTR